MPVFAHGSAVVPLLCDDSVTDLRCPYGCYATLRELPRIHRADPGPAARHDPVGRLVPSRSVLFAVTSLSVAARSPSRN
jgi:hypothetical protein